MPQDQPPNYTFIDQVETMEGPVFIMMVDGQLEVEIPQDKRITCPHCRRATWNNARWCHRCHFDLEAPAARVHPVKIIMLAVMCLIAALLSLILLTLGQYDPGQLLADAVALADKGVANEPKGRAKVVGPAHER